MKNKIVKIAGSVFGIAVFIAAILVLRHELAKYNYHEIILSLKTLTWGHLLLGTFFSACCYGALSFYDTTALRNIGNRLPYSRIALASFVGYAFGHNAGMTFITGGTIKYRIYSAWGIKAKDVAKIVVFNGITFSMGFIALLGMALVIEPHAIPASFDIPIHDSRPVGAALLVVIAGYFTVAALKGMRRPVIFGHEIPVPSPKIAAGQLAASLVEWLSASAILYLMFENGLPISYPAFVAIFLFAYVGGVVSQVPGGLGVFETVIVISLADVVPAPSVIAALLAYRTIYYILPLVIAIILFGAHEIHRKRNGAANFTDPSLP